MLSVVEAPIPFSLLPMKSLPATKMGKKQQVERRRALFALKVKEGEIFFSKSHTSVINGRLEKEWSH